MTDTAVSKTKPFDANPREIAFGVSGMDCASCVSHVEKAVGKVGGVQTCQVNLARGRAVVTFDPEQTNPNQIASAITDSGYPATPEADMGTGVQAEEQRLHRQRDEARAWFRRAVAGIVLWLPVELIHWIRHLHHARMGMSMPNVVDWMTWVSLVTSTIGIVYVGWAFYRSAFRAAIRRTSNMDTLIAMGASVAYLYSLGALVGHLARGWSLADLYFMEATGLLALISLGHWLEARARESAGSAIRELLNLAPATAFRVKGKEPTDPRIVALVVGGRPVEATTSSDDRKFDVEEIPVAQIGLGDDLLVRPGGRIPTDGKVVGGRSTVDESMITGEPMPVARERGDDVIGGTMNVDGALFIRATRVGSETALSQIIQLVEHAQSTKPAVQKLADQIAAVFVPTVLAIALLTGVGWYVYGTLHHWDSAHTFGLLAKAVCSVLIIACPCALGLAVPATLMVGTGMGAKRGILIRDIDALQIAEKIDTVVLDKTGTITQGKPVVSHIEAFDGVSADEVLRLAASAEQYSEHPLAKAIVAHARQAGLHLSEPTSFVNEAGMGVIAQIEGVTVLVGKTDLWIKQLSAPKPTTDGPPEFKQCVTPELVEKTMTDPKLKLREQVEKSGTVVEVFRIDNERGSKWLGFIGLVDELKTDSQQALRELHSMKLRTVLLSGDQWPVAKAIAARVRIDDVRAEVKPAGKADAIRELQNRQSQIGNRKSVVAMVGDGINDAPALAQADLGIAIGSGSDIAKETGDIVLVGGSLHGIATAIRLSRATMTKIRQNLFLAFIYNVLAIPLACLGLLNPLVAAAAMALSDVTVIGNALLLRRARIDPNPPQNET